MLDKILKSKVLSAIFLASFGFVSAAVIWAYAATKNIDGLIVVHFNNSAGISQAGTFLDLFLIGITGAVMVVVNFILALELEARDFFLGKIVAAATLFFSILIFIAFATIISVN
ncbi:MAG: hypothetical protein AAB602_01940 [Patescibacteria group bacterium]